MTSKIKKEQPAPPKRGTGRPPRDPNAPRRRVVAVRAPKQAAPGIVTEPLEIASFTIKEFMARNHISDGGWTNLCKPVSSRA